MVASIASSFFTRMPSRILPSARMRGTVPRPGLKPFCSFSQDGLISRSDAHEYHLIDYLSYHRTHTDTTVVSHLIQWATFRYRHHWVGVLHSPRTTRSILSNSSPPLFRTSGRIPSAPPFLPSAIVFTTFLYSSLVNSESLISPRLITGKSLNLSEPKGGLPRRFWNWFCQVITMSSSVAPSIFFSIGQLFFSESRHLPLIQPLR